MKKYFISFCFMTLVIASSGQNFTGGFNFRLPPFDTTTQFFLPKFSNEIIDDTSFVKTDHLGNFILHGKPQKFWGVIMSGRGYAPDKEDTQGIVGRMRKMGINMVRFNCIDNAGDFGLFFETPDTRHLNTTNLDKFEFLISHFKKNGIYVHMTLEDLRPYKLADGVIAADSMIHDAIINKAIPVFDRKLISLQKEHAELFLTHLNPYTGLSLANDPVLATVEIVNENSLFQWWRQEFLKPFSKGGMIPYYYSRELDTLWNNFLKQKYTTMQALAESWNSGSGSSNPEILKNPDFEAPDISADWQIILIDNATASLVKDNTTFHGGSSSAKVITDAYDNTDWHIMFIQNSLSFQKDSTYTVEFWAKANTNSSIQVNVGRENSPYTNYGSRIFNVGTTWQKFSYWFTAAENNTAEGCITINPRNNGLMWFDDISIRITSKMGNEANEDFNIFNIKRIDYRDRKLYTNKRISDLMEFYTKVQTDYFTEMYNYLRNDIGVKVPIEGTNYLVGPEDLLTLKDMDFIDNHSYWDHPTFPPNEIWSPDNWLIKNESMLKNDTANTITYLFSGFQKKGKPFVVGEYNHLFPNRYQTEMMAMISAYTSFQGADAILFNDYNQVLDWDLDRMSFYTTVYNNNPIMANFPVFGYAFRNNLIKEASSQIELNYSTTDLYTKLKPNYAPFSTSSFYPPKLALTNKIVTNSLNESSSTDPAELPAEPTNPYITSTGEIKWDVTGFFTIETDRLINFTGFLYNFPDKALTNATLVSADKFGTVTWLALDDTILTKSRKSLITISTRQQNTGMTWEGTTTIHNNWGNPPTEIEPMNVTLTLSIEADSIRVYPLNTLGAFDYSKYYSYKPVSSNKFTITLDQNTDKTCWYGVSTYIDGTCVTAVDEKILKDDCLTGNYPNPFSERTTIRYILSNSSDTELRIYDNSGHEVFQSRQENETQGEHEIQVDAHSLKAGVYLYTLKTNVGIYKAKLVVTK